MNIDDRALQCLQSLFGYEQFRGHQRPAIEATLQGRDSLVLMPTGGGKSLCYQIPSILLDGVGVVISPLIALMQDQVQHLRQNGVRATFINSSQSQAIQRQVESQALAGEFDLLYMAPERLLSASGQKLLQQLQIALFAIDEAHCVSQWGHDFRPEYTQLSALADTHPGVPRLALTATADENTRDDIKKHLRLDNADVFISSFDRPNIQYRIEAKNNPRSQLHQFIKSEYPKASGIVYCLSRKRTEETAAYLQGQGINALCYHAGMASEDRAEHMQRFIVEESVVMVATIAFGMGIDKPDVRYVAHLDMPKSIESYYQETGRAVAISMGVSDSILETAPLRRAESDACPSVVTRIRNTPKPRCRLASVSSIRAASSRATPNGVPPFAMTLVSRSGSRRAVSAAGATIWIRPEFKPITPTRLVGSNCDTASTTAFFACAI